jgi:hypothetical protein
MTPPLTRRQAIGMVGALALPLEPLRAATQPGTAATGGGAAASAVLPPDLANFHPMMEWIAREHAPRLSFLGSRWTSLEAWKAAARPLLRERLSYNPTPVPLQAQLVRREERDGFTVEVLDVSATAVARWTRAMARQSSAAAPRRAKEACRVVARVDEGRPAVAR